VSQIQNVSSSEAHTIIESIPPPGGQSSEGQPTEGQLLTEVLQTASFTVGVSVFPPLINEWIEILLSFKAFKCCFFIITVLIINQYETMKMMVVKIMK
jgi:hypothetical protein